MKSRARQPLILKKRKPPPPLPASPAEVDEARSRAGRLKQEQRVARQLRGAPASPGQVGAGDRSAPVHPPGVAAPAPAEAPRLPERPAPEQSPGGDPGRATLGSPDSGSLCLGTGAERGEEESLAASRGGPKEEEQLSGIWPWSPAESDFLALQSLGSREEEGPSMYLFTDLFGGFILPLTHPGVTRGGLHTDIKTPPDERRKNNHTHRHTHTPQE